MPELINKHTHTKTKFIHLFHPKKIHIKVPSHHGHSRKDPNMQMIKELHAGFIPSQMTAHILDAPKLLTKEEFNRWRENELTKARQAEKQAHPQKDLIEKDTDDYESGSEDEEDSEEDNDSYKNSYKSSKNSHSSSSKKKATHNDKKPMKHNRKHKSQHQSHQSSMNRNVYRAPEFPTGRKLNYQDITVHPNGYSYPKPIAVYDHYSGEASNTHFSVEPTAIDPGYYSTLPNDQEIQKMTGREDEIYSGLLTMQNKKHIGDKTRMLKTMNKNRKRRIRNTSEHIAKA